MKNPAAQLARMRRTSRKACAECGETFTGIAIRRYCSEKCKTRAKRAKKQGTTK